MSRGKARFADEFYLHGWTNAAHGRAVCRRNPVTGFGMVDGMGHVGGGIGVLVIAPAIPHMTVLEAMLVVSGFLVAAAIIAQFSPNTRGRYHEEISP
jgi:MFS transporter, putative metabolite:H+ symporter